MRHRVPVLRAILIAGVLPGRALSQNSAPAQPPAEAQVAQQFKEVAALLKSLPTPIDRSQLVFGHEDKPATWMAMKRAWKAACVAAKVKDYRWHDQRHQAATELINRGATLYDVPGFLQHRTPAMSARYSHLTDDRREQTARLLDAPVRRRSMVPKTATGIGGNL